MSLASLPLVLFLLLPGFLCINVAFLVGTFHRLSAFHGFAWSLLTSFVLISITYPLYISLVDPPSGTTSWPGLLQAIENPILVPGQVWAILYAFAILAGIALGIGERRAWLGSLLIHASIDLSKRGDPWSRAFRNENFVQIYLKDGTLLVGWPEYYSTDRSLPGPELYLTDPQVWSEEKSAWLDLADDVTGILLHGDEISRIEFLDPVHERDEVTVL